MDKLGKIIRKEEFGKVVPSFLFIFFLMVAYYIAKPVREALSLEVGVKNLPYMTLFTITSTFIFNFIYDFMARNFERRKLVISVFTILIGVFAIFAVIIKSTPEIPKEVENAIYTTRGMLIVGYVVWVSVFIPFCVAMLWSFINDIFTSEQGKRLFGIIGAGGPVGALVGGILTSHIVKLIGVGNLLFISSFFILLALFSMLWADRVDKMEKSVTPQSELDNTKTDIKEDTDKNKQENGFQLIFKNRYLLFIVAMVILTTATSNIFYNNYARLVKANFSGTDAIAAHYASYYNYLNIIGASIQFFITGWLLTTLGLLAGLLILPLIDTANLFMFSSGASFSFITWGMILSLSSTYSIYNASKEVLYTPTPKSFKYQAKGIIDTFCFRIGSGLSALMLIAQGNMGFSMKYLFIVAGFILLARYVVVCNLSISFKEYENKGTNPDNR